ncbi:MAG: SIMPL domain-containing protein [Nakamurella sp.]
MRKSSISIAGAVVGILLLSGCSGAGEESTAQSVSSVGVNSAPVETAPVGTAPIETAPLNAAAPDGAAAANAPAAGVAAAPVNAGAATAAGVVTAPADTNKRLITAQAVGSVTGTPDVLTVTMGVQTTSASAQSAIDENNRLANDTIAVIKAGGVADADLQTSQLTVNPTYDNNNAITGYQVSNMVTATLRDIAGAGALIDAVGKAAGDAVRVQQLSFSIDDDSALRAAARADAVKRAQAQAQQLAEAAGVALGPVDSITETQGASPVSYAAPMAADAASSVPIQAGSQELTVVVQVVYQIG